MVTEGKCKVYIVNNIFVTSGTERLWDGDSGRFG